jgi:hypothetical protein
MYQEIEQTEGCNQRNPGMTFNASETKDQTTQQRQHRRQLLQQAAEELPKLI